MGWCCDEWHMHPIALELSFQFHFYGKMGSDKDMHLVVDCPKLRVYHGHMVMLFYGKG